jgi:hypothetical protein
LDYLHHFQKNRRSVPLSDPTQLQISKILTEQSKDPEILESVREPIYTREVSHVTLDPLSLRRGNSMMLTDSKIVIESSKEPQPLENLYGKCFNHMHTYPPRKTVHARHSSLSFHMQKPLFMQPSPLNCEKPKAFAKDHVVVDLMDDTRSTIKIESKPKTTNESALNLRLS